SQKSIRESLMTVSSAEEARAILTEE
ncbi:TPA: PTS sugar transporter subunit IIA, partial [Neisseria meningitidis]